MSAWDSAKAWVERRPKRAVLVTAVVAFLVGSQIGLLVGYKIEHDRVADDVKRLKKSGAVANNKTAKVGAARVSGKVTATAADTITITTKSGTSRTVNLSTGTVIEQTTKGARSAIAVGRHVFVVPPGKEVMVLSATSTDGREVTESTADSFSIAASKGLPAGKVKTNAETVVDTLVPAKKTDVKVGGSVMVLGTAPKGGPVAATEVIVLPATSGFAG